MGIQRGVETGLVLSQILLVAPARAPLLLASKQIDRCLRTPQSRAHLRRRANLLDVPQHRVYPTATISWTSPTPRDRPLARGEAPSVHKSIRPHSSVRCARNDSHVPTTCGRIFALTPMNVPSYAAFAARLSLASTTESDTRVSTPVKRSSSAAAISKTMVIGVAAGGSLAQMLSVVTSGLRLAESASVPCSRRKRKRRGDGTDSSNIWPTVTASSTLCRRTLVV